MAYGKIYETTDWGDGRVNLNDWGDIYEGLGYDDDYAAVLSAGTTNGFAPPTAAHQVLQNTFVKALKDADVWNELDLLYIFAVTTVDSSSDFTLLNLKSPTQFKLTKVSSPTFTSNKGWSNGGTSRLATGFTLNADGTNYTQNDAGGFAAFPIMNSSSQTNNRIYGNDGSSNYLSPRLQVDGSNSGNRNWINDNQFQEMDIHKDNDTIFFQNRVASDTINYRSTDLAASNTKSATDSSGVESNALPADDLILLGARSSDQMFAGNTMGMFGFGGSLTDAKMSAIETAWYTNYYTKL